MCPHLGRRICVIAQFCSAISQPKSAANFQRCASEQAHDSLVGRQTLVLGQPQARAPASLGLPVASLVRPAGRPARKLQTRGPKCAGDMFTQVRGTCATLAARLQPALEAAGRKSSGGGCISRPASHFFSLNFDYIAPLLAHCELEARAKHEGGAPQLLAGAHSLLRQSALEWHGLTAAPSEIKSKVVASGRSVAAATRAPWSLLGGAAAKTIQN